LASPGNQCLESNQQLAELGMTRSSRQRRVSTYVAYIILWLQVICAQ